MAVALIPPGAGIPSAILPCLKSLYDAVRDLQSPGGPVQLPHIDTKANLKKLDASAYPDHAIICDELNALCVSTLVSGAYAWRRADGGAL